MQYIYCTLGTPKVMGYIGFEELPLAATMGRHILVRVLFLKISCRVVCSYYAFFYEPHSTGFTSNAFKF